MSSITLAQETEAITRFESLSHQIAIAAEQSLEKTFDYESAPGNKAARSWIADLRKIKGSIERARKDAKSVHLERGRAVDAAAKQLEADVQKLIEPHETQIKAIEAREVARVDAHRKTLEKITALTEGVTTSSEAKERLAQVEAIDITGLEEFAEAGKSRKYDAEEKLHSLYDSLLQREAEQAELEALRAQNAALENKLKAVRNIAPANTDPRPIQSLETKKGQADAGRDASNEIAEIEAIALTDAFVKILATKIQGMTRTQVAAAIIDGSLHPAIKIDWTKVA